LNQNRYQYSRLSSEDIGNGYGSRIAILRVIFVLLLALLVAQLIRKQVLEYSTYKAMAQGQQTAKLTSTPDRGIIYAYDKTAGDMGVTAKEGERQYHPLAINMQKYNVVVVPKNVIDPDRVVDELSKRFPDIDKNKLATNIKSKKIYIPPVAKKVEKDQAEEISKLNMAGVMTVPTTVRYYPEGSLAAQVLGFVNYEDEGAYGIERYYNGELKGIPGVIYGLKDTHGRVIEVNDQAKATDGVSIVLSIDSTVQFIVEQELKKSIEAYKAEGGTVIIMEPRTGKIIAMANEPAYDPNAFNKVPESEQWKFVNSAVTDVWEPGSIMKPVIMAGAIDGGTVEPDTKPEKPFGNVVTIDDYEIHNAQDKSYGMETMTEVIKNSDNIGMAWLSEKMGKDIMAKYLTDFGFGAKTGIDVEAESIGMSIDPKKWSKVQRANISFGQGILTTPLQMVTAYGAIANGGKLVKPHLLDTVIAPNGEKKQIQTTDVRQVIKQETADKMKEMLINVVDNGHGKKAAVEGYKVAGKTGTAQIAKKGGGYEENQHIGSFVGYAPADNPKFVMLVKLDKPQNVEFAESSAAPTFGTIAKWLLTNYYK